MVLYCWILWGPYLCYCDCGRCAEAFMCIKSSLPLFEVGVGGGLANILNPIRCVPYKMSLKFYQKRILVENLLDERRAGNDSGVSRKEALKTVNQQALNPVCYKQTVTYLI